MTAAAGYGEQDAKSQQNVWGGQAGYLSDLFSQSQRLAQTQQGQNMGAFADARMAQAVPAWTSLLNPQGNPALTSSIDAMSGDVSRNLTRNLMPALESSAVAAGGVGGARGSLAAGQLASDASGQVADYSARMRGAAYEGDQGRKLQAVGMGNQMAEGGTIGSTANWLPIMQQRGVLGAPTVLGDSTSRGRDYKMSGGWK